MSKTKGFTLIELLVVISIVAILSVIGMVVFTGVQKSARDSQRRSDIEAIAKAYEVSFNSTGSYGVLTGQNFASGSRPKDPNPSKGEYFTWLDSAGSGFKVCASLEANPNFDCRTPAVNCYCQFSSQGSVLPGSSPNPSGSFHYSGGLGGSSSAPACDPNGTLAAGLVGYWKMDEGRDNTVADSSDNNNINAWNDAVWLPLEGAENNCISGACLRFDGVNDHIAIQDSSSLTPLNAITVSLWVRARDCQPDSVYSGDAAHVIYKGESYGVYCYNRPGSKIRFSGWVRIGADSSRTYSGGNNGLPPRYRLNGDLDDIRIYNKALTPDEVELLYNGGDGCF